MPFTDEQKQKYLAERGRFCPDCGSDNISTGEMERSGVDGTWFCDVWCGDCDAEWQNIYELTGIHKHGG